jgi:hypothetical protein
LCAFTDSCSNSFSNPDGSVDYTVTVTYENEETTQEIIDSALAQLCDCPACSSPVYDLNDDESCVHAYCSRCGFVNPDDGLTYLRRTYTYTLDNTCCTDHFSQNCSLEATSDCDHVPCWGGTHCPAFFFWSSRAQSELADEYYDEACNLFQDFEDITIVTYCFCHPDSTICDPPLPDGNQICCPDPAALHLCPAACQSVIAPYALDCTTFTSTVTYSLPCTP